MVNIQIIKAESDADFDHVFAIRAEVFKEELGIEDEEEYDGLDHISNHYIAILDGVAVGTARWRLGPHVPVARLERFAIKKAYRGQGAGSALFEKMKQNIPGDVPLEVYALIDTIPFFEKRGLKPEGDPFELAGLAHQMLVSNQAVE